MFQLPKNLADYVKHTNNWRKVWGNTELSLSSAQDRQTLADNIDSELSPENLSCDGELPRSHVEAKYRALTKVATELKRMDPSVKFYEFE